MNKIALITDTTSDLSKETIEKYNINVLPFRIIYSDREYLDNIDISPQEVYDNMKTEVPTSSLPSMKDMEELFLKLEEEGYTHVIAITLSTGLSGIFNAVKLTSENHPSIITHVCDSQSIALGEGLIVTECGKLIQEGKSFEEIVEAIPSIKKRIHLYFVVGTLEYLKKGGRIGKVAGTIAELLNIKPIISFDDEGKYCTCEKVRGRKQSLNKLVELTNSILDKKKCRVYILHGDALEESKKVMESISLHPNAISVEFGGYISPVSGVHSGPGLVGMVCIEEP
ncbi:DegV family protein [Clostridium sp. CM028]|uniref:DegV family protein n=1 Tax=unclassified Clostridium TaxID=2614128 RepID=UPI001C0CF92E|nr:MULTISPECIES: DegV family protein [unclassified Clostridium]MBU3092634.1 DegV family protein [Clostridium sp. CF011]MBW9145324.1 DegV family protein [Clostridium sp. CM027]MBW9148861.1 DegV family protein [Clostridium sp. CM028]UVE42463.1 DegV family protein [Clostridium sp. CM027]WAG71482.1 DegV family protein [Clostridium sp. CF011]